MPVDKLISVQKVIRCSKCGESKFTLTRVKDSNGNKIKPAKYICVKCLNK